MKTLNQRSAISKINKRGALLVFPIHNRPQPHSLWAEFFPRSRMRWEWDDSGDNRVGEMWYLMKRLSDCRKVVYSKWYQGRATFFSRELFTAMLAVYQRTGELSRGLLPESQIILETLESDSPLSTKELKRFTDLQGKENEAAYNRATKELFSRLLVVAFGEVDDGSFPSLAIGATRLIYEDLWNEALEMDPNRAETVIDKYMPAGSLFRKQFEKTKAVLAESAKFPFTRDQDSFRFTD